MSQLPFFINPSCCLPASVTGEVCRAALAWVPGLWTELGFFTEHPRWVPKGRAELCARFSLVLRCCMVPSGSGHGGFDTSTARGLHRNVPLSPSSRCQGIGRSSTGSRWFCTRTVACLRFALGKNLSVRESWRAIGQGCVWCGVLQWGSAGIHGGQQTCSSPDVRKLVGSLWSLEHNEQIVLWDYYLTGFKVCQKLCCGRTSVCDQLFHSPQISFH